jgi:hypothetical protein
MSSNDLTSEVVLASLSSFENYDMGGAILILSIAAVVVFGLMYLVGER